MKRCLLWCLSFAAVGALPLLASAQCAPGRVANDATGGRCCWPGQSWSEDRDRCEGPPTCPAGMWGEGSDCVAAASPQPAAPPPTFAAPPPAEPRQATFAAAEPRAPSATGTEPIAGLAIAGGVSLGVTYLATVIASAVAMTSCYSGCPEYALNFIPVVGPIVWVALDSGRYGNTWTYVFYFPASIIGAVSFTLLLAGVIIQRPVPTYQVGWAPEVTGGPGDLGVGLRWAF